MTGSTFQYSAAETIDKYNNNVANEKSNNSITTHFIHHLIITFVKCFRIEVLKFRSSDCRIT